MSPDIDVEKIIKAEINRNLGRFNICLDLLSGMNGKQVEAIREQAIKRSDLIFKLADTQGKNSRPKQ